MDHLDEPHVVTPDLVAPPRDGGYTKGQETRDMILRTALGLLIEEGYRGLSMRRVAAACAMKFGNLTYHYRTSQDLMRELLEAVICTYEREFDALMPRAGLAPEERLARYCQLVLGDITTKKTTRLFPELWAMANHDAFVAARMHELYARARRPLIEIMADMRPDLGGEEHEALALFISYSMEGATIFAGHDKPFTARMGCLKRISLAGFLAVVKSYARA